MSRIYPQDAVIPDQRPVIDPMAGGIVIAVAALVPIFLLPWTTSIMNAVVLAALVSFLGACLLPSRTKPSGYALMLALGLGIAGDFLAYNGAAPVASSGRAILFALALTVVFGALLNWRHTGMLRRTVGTSLWRNLTTIVTLLAGILLYAWAVVVTVDQLGERGPAQRFQAEFYHGDFWHNKRGDVFYELHLAPWGPRPAEATRVDLATFDAARPGENVCPVLHHGLLGIGWFQVASCPLDLRPVVHPIPRDLAAEQRRGDLNMLPLMALGGVMFLLWVGYGLVDGVIDGRGREYVRGDQPILYWVHVVIYATCGAALLLMAISQAIRDFG